MGCRNYPGRVFCWRPLVDVRQGKVVASLLYGVLLGLDGDIDSIQLTYMDMLQQSRPRISIVRAIMARSWAVILLPPSNILGCVTFNNQK